MNCLKTTTRRERNIENLRFCAAYINGLVVKDLVVKGRLLVISLIAGCETNRLKIC